MTRINVAHTCEICFYCWHHQGNPSIQGTTHQTAGRAESGSDRDYLNGLVEATAFDKDNQVRIGYM